MADLIKTKQTSSKKNTQREKIKKKTKKKTKRARKSSCSTDFIVTEKVECITIK